MRGVKIIQPDAERKESAWKYKLYLTLVSFRIMCAYDVSVIRVLLALTIIESICMSLPAFFTRHWLVGILPLIAWPPIACYLFAIYPWTEISHSAEGLMLMYFIFGSLIVALIVFSALNSFFHWVA